MGKREENQEVRERYTYFAELLCNSRFQKFYVELFEHHLGKAERNLRSASDPTEVYRAQGAMNALVSIDPKFMLKQAKDEFDELIEKENS